MHIVTLQTVMRLNSRRATLSSYKSMTVESWAPGMHLTRVNINLYRFGRWYSV